jgi:hypothetical protein
MEAANYDHHHAAHQASVVVDHQNGTAAHRRWAPDQTLHVAMVYSNPYRFRSRISLFNDCYQHLTKLQNLEVYVCELAYGDRPFEVTNSQNPNHLQLRTGHVLWHKENQINLCVSKFDPTWKYGAWIDADVLFTRSDFGIEVIHALQHHAFVQPFSSYTNVSPSHRPLSHEFGFAYKYCTNRLPGGSLEAALKMGAAGGDSGDSGCELKMGSKGRRQSGGIGAVGLAWAFRRDAFNAVGGMIDICLLGSADYYMTLGLVGHSELCKDRPELIGGHPHYREMIAAWQDRALRACKQNIGYVDCYAIHHWHGSKRRRFYGERQHIIARQQYDPMTDIYRDSFGVYQLNPDRIGLRDELEKYFSSRKEDSVDLMYGEVEIGD